MNVALVQDWLTGMRGGEWVLEEIAGLCPADAPIYTLLHRKGSVSAAIESHPIRTSFLQRIPGIRRHYRRWLPLMPLAAESFDLRGYDLVLSTSHCVAKGVRPAPGAGHVSYLHTPMRYIWHLYDEYARGRGAISRGAMAVAAHQLRIWDVASSDRVDHFLANSETVRRRIEQIYRREAEVIHPPVDTAYFTPRDGAPPRGIERIPPAGGEMRDGRGYYLLVSALVPYKRIDLAMRAFEGSATRLVIAGSGPEERRLRRLAPAEIEFVGWQPREALRELYRGARALVFPGLEDFGMTPVECMATGTPVIAYGAGGVTESVVGPVVDEGGPTGEYVGRAGRPDEPAGFAERRPVPAPVRPGAHPPATGVFFGPQTAEALRAAVGAFERMSFDRRAIRARALEFSRERFRERFSAAVERLTGHRLGAAGEGGTECMDTRAS